MQCFLLAAPDVPLVGRRGWRCTNLVIRAVLSSTEFVGLTCLVSPLCETLRVVCLMLGKLSAFL